MLNETEAKIDSWIRIRKSYQSQIKYKQRTIESLKRQIKMVNKELNKLRKSK